MQDKTARGGCIGDCGSEDDRDRWGCIICSSEAQDAVVTLCGHLFCWGCIYEWFAVSAAEGRPRECPLCKKRVKKSGGIIPIYASSGSNTRDSKALPRSPRPSATPLFSPDLRASSIFESGSPGLMMSWSSAGGGAGWVLDAHPFQDGFSMRSVDDTSAAESDRGQESRKESMLKILILALTVIICAMTIGKDGW